MVEDTPQRAMVQSQIQLNAFSLSAHGCLLNLGEGHPHFLFFNFELCQQSFHVQLCHSQILVEWDVLSNLPWTINNNGGLFFYFKKNPIYITSCLSCCGVVGIISHVFVVAFFFLKVVNMFISAKMLTILPLTCFLKQPQVVI